MLGGDSFLGAIQEILKDISVPEVVDVQQTFSAPVVEDVRAAVRIAISSRGVLKKVKRGDRVAIAVGAEGLLICLSL